MSDRLGGGEAVITRHGDKGAWKADIALLKSELPPEQVQLVQTVLHEEFPGMTETPLTREGIVRSLKLGEEFYKDLPPVAVVVFSDSGKERAHLTRALVAARIQQLSEHGGAEGVQPKLLDLVHIEIKEMTANLKDAHDATWEPYGKLVAAGMNELDALALWVNDMNKPGANIPADQHPHEARERYSAFLALIKERVQTTGRDQDIPVVFFAAGHSGSLAQVDYESAPNEKSGKDMPKFCEMFRFDEKGFLVGRKEVEI